MTKIVPPCAFQGGKQRVASEIVNYIISNEIVLPSINGTKIYDLCCGSGAITLEFISRGVHPTNITMCDIGSWGKFWKSIGKGEFSLETFDYYCNQVPHDRSRVQEFLIELSKSDATVDEEYKYILLQAGSFGGKQIYRDENTWQNTFFRSYWQPTETSKRRSPVNPMQPSIDELQKRIHIIAEKCVGLNVIHGDVYDSLDVIKNDDATERIVYVDPPYSGTTGYRFTFDYLDFLSKLYKETLSPIYVSESKALSNECIQLKFNGAKGGISGVRKGKHQEWLNVFR